MSPQTLAEAQQILEFTDEYLGTLKEAYLEKFKVVFCPPFVFIEEIAKILETSKLSEIASLGAQDIFWEDKGADTGEISGPMLNKLKVRYVIVGHSERRWKLGESDETVNKKLKAVLRNAMVPIVCIGDKTCDGDFKGFLKQQVESTFSGLSADEVGKCIVAYEPVWAISSSPNAKPDAPESAVESIKIIEDFITKNYKLKTINFLYGGSVNSQNISDFLKYDEISGVLVGAASVDKKEFVNILRKLIFAKGL